MNGKICLVTGASRRSRAMTAHALAAAGATVPLHGRDAERGAAAAADIARLTALASA